MSGLFLSLLSVALGALLAGSFGLFLGRVGTAWNSGRAFVNLLTEARGALLPFVLAPVVLSIEGMPQWCAIGLVAGMAQAVAIGRWIIRNDSDWSALVGGIALGQSGASLAARSAAARGAVTAALALTAVQVVALEALLAWTQRDDVATRSLGGVIVLGGGWSALLGGLTLAALLLGLETLAARALQGDSLFMRRVGRGSAQ